MLKGIDTTEDIERCDFDLKEIAGNTDLVTTAS